MSLRLRIGKRLAALFTGGLTLVAAAATAGPPSGRALPLDPAGAGAANKADGQGRGDAAKDEQDGRAYYYSEGRKIYLDDTGLAVAKLKAGVNPEAGDLPFRASRLDAESPLGELAARLARAGLVVVNTSGPQSLDLRKADEPPASVDYVLPVVKAEVAGSGLDPRSASSLIFTPRIAARFAEGVTRAQVDTYAAGAGLKVARAQDAVPNGYVLELADGTPTYTRLLKAANTLYEKGKDDQKLVYAHPDFIPTKVRHGLRPNSDDPPGAGGTAVITDPLFAKQWHLNNTGEAGGKPGADVRALAAWEKTTGSASVVVAVIDDSVQQSHPDLAPNFKAGRYYDGVTGTSTDDPSPKDGSQRHGTSCAGVAVAASNALGGRGVAPGCKLVGVNFWDGSVAQTADGFYFADQQGASVISCSWSWGAAFDAVSTAIKDLARNGRGGKGTVILFAAGNEYGTVAANQAFGRLPEVIIVGATNWRDDHSKYSNTGPEVSIVAPSSDLRDTPASLSILTTDNTDDMPRPAGANFSGYAVDDFTPNRGRAGFGGTSSATPLVAGVCALMLSRNPQLTAVQVRKILEETADKIPGETVAAVYTNGHDVHYGHGRINARRAVDAAAPSTAPRDLTVGHFEITQGLQRNSNDIPLVLGKPTVIRVFPRVADGGAAVPGVGARLHAFRDGTELAGSPILPDNGPATADATADRGDPNDSLNFTLDPDWYGHDTRFWAELILPAGLTDPNPSDNRFPVGAGSTFPASYQDRRGLSIRFVRIHYTNPNWGGDRRPRPRVGEQATCDWARAIYPVDPTEMPYDPWAPEEIQFGQGDGGGDLNGNALITELNTLLATSSSPPDRLYGWTPELSFSSNGLSDPLWAGGQGRVVFGNDTEGNSPPSTSRYRRTFAHELGHNTDANGLFHTDRRLQDDEFGFDVLNVDPFRRKVMRKYPSTSTTPSLDLFDVMRGGELEPNAWITPPHYLHVFNALVPAGAGGGAVADAPAREGNGNGDGDGQGDDGDLLVVRGEVYRDDPGQAGGGGRFFPFYRIPATAENRRMAANPPQQGTHKVRFLDGEGRALRVIAWTPDFRDDDSPNPVTSRPFTWNVEPLEGVKKVELLNRDRVIATLDVAPQGPVISNLRQEAPRQAAADVDVPGAPNVTRVRLSWDAARLGAADGGAEEDGKNLVHQIYYSNNDGKSWRLVASGLTQPTVDLDVSTLPGGGRGLFQLRTTDGYNVATRTTGAVSLADQSPKADIIAPRSGNTYNEGGGILLIGRGYDPEEGAVPADRCAWRSDIQGDLGTGTKLVVRNLASGTHRVTLTVRDSKGNQGVSSPVEVRVRTR